MPTQLATVNLAAAIVGTTGSISLSNAAISSDPSYTNRPYYLVLFNESACGLNLAFDGGSTDFCPAGAWRKFPLPFGASVVTYSVQYVLNSAPLNTVFPIVYMPGEPIDLGILGNSPVNVGNTVSTNFSSLTNDGNVAGTQIIESTPGVTVTQVSVKNDGTTILGYFELDPNSGAPRLIFDRLALNGETVNSIQIVTANGTSGLVELHIKNPTGAHSFVDMQTGSIDYYPNGGIACQGLIVNSSATMNSVLLNSGGHGGGLSGCTQFSGAATNTYTHGLNTTPGYVGPMSTANGSQTMGADSYGSSTVHVTSAAGQTFKALAIV